MLAAIFRIVALARKELLAMLKDPRARYASGITNFLDVLDAERNLQ